MRLEAASLGALHFYTDRRDRAQVHAFQSQLALGHELFNRLRIEDLNFSPIV
jgi:hypothetical protein